MRIDGAARTTAADGGDPAAARFGDALARAGAGERGGGRAGAREDGRAEAREDGRAGARTCAGAAGPGRSRARAQAASAPAGDEAPPPAPGPAARVALAPELAPAAELARALRVVPPAAAILGPAGGAPLTLSFGRSLDVELRATAAGVDVVLRPAPALVRAAEAELPRLVAALRVRGVAVARVTIRSYPPTGARAR
jgi:hypothetical protein